MVVSLFLEILPGYWPNILLPRTSLATSNLLTSTFVATSWIYLLPRTYLFIKCCYLELPRQQVYLSLRKFSTTKFYVWVCLQQQYQGNSNRTATATSVMTTLKARFPQIQSKDWTEMKLSLAYPWVPRGGTNLLFDQCFSKIAWKRKKLVRREQGTDLPLKLSILFKLPIDISS